MRQTTLGDTGLRVSELGFGAIPIQRLSEQDAIDVVRYAFDSGVTFFDTAAGYGTSEERIGKALEDVRDKVVIATKSGAASAEECRAQFQRSLKRLRTGRADIFQFHAVSSPDKYGQIMSPGGAYEYAVSAREEGLIGHIGFSSHNSDVALEMVRSGKFETVQFPFNLIATLAAEEIFPEAEKRGMGVIVMKPFGGGAIESAEAAFAYLRQFPSYLPIPGIEYRAQLDQVLRLYETENAVTAAMKETWQAIRRDLGMYFCRRCGYCSPCPEGVQIVGLMTLDTLMKRFPTDRLLTEEWIVNGAQSLDKCIECGKCEEQCPYDLDIRVKMRANRDAYIEWRKCASAS